MDDLITPTGRFLVDIILCNDPHKCAIAPELRHRYARRGIDLGRGAKLQALFATMNDLDFDGDGKPDRAYGTAYIGLNGPGSGPKLSQFKGRTYWYSIALHGTPDEKRNLGRMNSGGCVHLGGNILNQILAKNTVAIGSTVVISDKPPSSPENGGVAERYRIKQGHPKSDKRAQDSQSR